jgi:DNA invertase Pin-like site-specific DNA recombinase
LTAQDPVLVTARSRLGRRLLDMMQLLSCVMAQDVTGIGVKAGREGGDTRNAKVLAWAFGLAVDSERSLSAARPRAA